MKKNLLLINISILTLLLSSCSSTQNTSTAPSPAPTPSPGANTRPNPAATPSPVGNPQTIAQVPSSQGIPTSVPIGIEPSTNPQQRLSEIAKGRMNPFAPISIKPKVTILPSEEPLGSKTPTGAKTPTSAKTPTFAKKPIKIAKTPTGIKISTSGKKPLKIPKTNNKPSPNNKNIKNLPPKVPIKPGEKIPPALPPEPDLAKAVSITGVIELNGIPYAIVSSPEEPFSRYVQTGQYLAQGQVLVKRIDIYAGTPSVVLEQYGVQVIKRVGEKPEVEDNKTGKTAAFFSNEEIP